MFHAFRTIARLLLVAAAWSALPAHAASEDDFLAAREAFRAGDARKLDTYARRLQGHVLEPYATYWQLRLRLENAAPEEVRRFIVNYSDTLLAGRMLGEWLRQLARTQQWDLFDAEYPRYTGEELDLICYGFQSKARSGALEALQDARSLWFVPRELPENCTPLFNVLVQDGRLSPDDIWTRIRIALETGQISAAVRTALYLASGEHLDARALPLISSNPAGYLEKQRFELRTRAGRETAMFAVYRLARTSPQQAAAHWVRLENRFSPDERAYVWGQIAQFSAMRHEAEALGWFAKAGDLSDTQLAWKARTALRQLDWREVRSAIDAMTDKEREQAAWRYWKARALKSTGHREEATGLFKSIAHEYSFYGQLALEELGDSISTPPVSKVTPAEVKAVADQAGIRRALALFSMGLRVDAIREWIFTIRRYDDRQLIAAAEVARRHELFDRTINTADRTVSVHDFTLRYIAPYREVLKARADQHALDEAWVYGLIRQESRFIVGARSRAGASGLMQIMPATAKWVARKMGLKRIGDMTEIDTNVSLGTYYLRHVLDTLDGQPVLASAAYNAGPGRARAWRPDSAVEGAIYAESIPFSETRDYVKKVMSNASYYAHVFSQQLQSLRQRLGVIAPRQRALEAGLGDTP
ncbi:MAG: transglycosylase SLT domain-containing protein [Burkholderiales bacterium]